MTGVVQSARGREHVHSKMEAAHAKFHVPSAREVDGWVYLTVVMAAHEEGDGPGYSAGFGRAFEHVAEVLEMAGCCWNDVVAITSHHLDIHAQLQDMAEVKDLYCNMQPYPAWSILANPRGFCEIVVVARAPA